MMKPYCFWEGMVSLAASACSSSHVVGGSWWNCAASLFICGESPTHDENVMVTGLVGSVGVIGLIVCPGDRGWALLLGAVPPLTQADPMSAAATMAPASGPPRPDSLRPFIWLPPVLSSRRFPASIG